MGLGLNMNKHIFNLDTLRLSMGGAILGVALMGLIWQFPYHDAIGAFLGSAAVFIAKARHFF